jgi:hypothetical protein
MEMDQSRRVLVEPEVVEQLRSHASAQGSGSPPEDRLPPKSGGTTVVVLAYLAYRDAQLLDDGNALPKGLIGIDLPEGADASMDDLDHLAAKLDRDLLVRRQR